MNWFKNLRVGVKLLSGFLLIAAIGIGVGVFATQKMTVIDDRDTFLFEKASIPLGLIAEYNQHFGAVRANILRLAITDKSEHSKILQVIQDKRALMDKCEKDYEPTFIDENDRIALQKLKDARAKYRIPADNVIELFQAGRESEAKALLFGDYDRVLADFNKEVETLTEMNVKAAKAISDENTVIANNAKTVVYTFLAIGLAISVILGVMISRMITNPVAQALNVANALADGDLTVKVDAHGKDEIAQMLAAIDRMLQKLQQVVSDVQSASCNVSSGSQQLASSSQEMSQGATEQAASIEEVSSSMEEMASNIQQNTDNARQTEQLAVKSAADAREGGQAVQQTVHAMKEIAEKISIIEEIARQTNLLALNAAIEAARAGEAGKGFAVVASEVRKLAERSQSAAAQISSLSSSSVEVAEKAGEMLKKIVPDIQRTAELVQEVAAASTEQSAGAQQVNKAVQQLDTVVQQNASGSEEMASTAEELSSQAAQLQESISFFRLDGDGRGSVALKAQHRVKIAHVKAGPKTERPMLPSSRPAKGAKGGVSLDLGEDTRDAEFESF